MSQSDSHVDVTPQETTGRTVVGLFGHRSAAEAAIRDLRDAGFADGQIGVAMQERVEQGDLLEEAGSHSAEGAAKVQRGGSYTNAPYRLRSTFRTKGDPTEHDPNVGFRCAQDVPAQP